MKIIFHQMKALFPGSFNPFTTGHDDIVRRGLALFGEVEICIGVNAGKPACGSPFGTARERAADIRAYYEDTPGVTVSVSERLITEAALDAGADVLLRSVRSVKDYEYEREMAAVNRAISGLDTVILFASPALGDVSSSIVRELLSYNHDISKFIPQNFIISSLKK